MAGRYGAQRSKYSAIRYWRKMYSENQYANIALLDKNKMLEKKIVKITSLLAEISKLKQERMELKRRILSMKYKIKELEKNEKKMFRNR